MSRIYTNEGVFYKQSRRIKIKRRMANLSQSGLAKICNISTSTIWRVERCETSNENLYAQVEGTLDKILKKNKNDLITHYESRIAQFEEFIGILKEV